MNKKIHTFAFYLPQFHPIKENNEWFGEGFTEWTNVGKTRPLFRGHYQPRVPADLGYYDLRVPEVRRRQAEMAKEAGIDCFCYYHYWFGNGKRLMEMPIEEVTRTGQPDFPFCLCWANHTFYKKTWNSAVKELDFSLLLEQTYPGIEDIKNHFYTLLHIFKDKRYYKIDNRLVFVLYDISKIPNVEQFIKIWNDLAITEGLNGFYFISYTTNPNNIREYPFSVTDSVILALHHYAFTNGKSNKFNKYIKTIKELLGNYLGYPMSVVKYKHMIKYLVNEVMMEDKVIPCVIPNWDVSPRRGSGATIMHNSTPELFRTHLIQAVDLIKMKPDDKRILFIKSWNEWGEGNYLEPDLRHGKGYINVLKEVLNNH